MSACSHRRIVKFYSNGVICHPQLEGDTHRCYSCGAWLSLGPSDDAPEAVRIEMRAAAIEACRLDAVADGTGYLVTIGEHDGSRIASGTAQYLKRDWPVSFRELAGYLAYCIAEHDSGTPVKP